MLRVSSQSGERLARFCLQPGPAGCERLGVFEVDEMSRAAAVGGAESGWKAPPDVCKQLRPLTFNRDVFRRPPHIQGGSGGTKRVDVPMSALLGGWFEVAPNPGAQAAGPTRAADIEINTRRELDVIQTSDPQAARSLQPQDQTVMAGLVGQRLCRRRWTARHLLDRLLECSYSRGALRERGSVVHKSSWHVDSKGDSVAG